MPSSTHLLAALAAVAVPAMAAESCISLSGSTQCPAFNGSSISTDQTLKGLFPFLQYVSSREDFDTQLSRYVNTSYVQSKYQAILGCSNVNLSNTTAYYARYTTSVICNAIVQNSIQPCGLSGAARAPLCADSCATFAQSEEEIAMSQDLCKSTNSDLLQQIRADFTNCALPTDALTGSCIPAEANQPDDCGFDSNIAGLCSYCATSSPNATDSCCVASKLESRCQGIKLPSSLTSLPPLFSSAAPTSDTTATVSVQVHASNSRLSGGAIAGIVIGSVAGAALIALLAALLFICLRRRRSSRDGSIFNQPSPRREAAFGAPPVGNRSLASRDYSQPTPGGRVTRMTAMDESDDEDDESDEIYTMNEKGRDSPPYEGLGAIAPLAAGAGIGAAAAPVIRDGKHSALGGRLDTASSRLDTASSRLDTASSRLDTASSRLNTASSGVAPVVPMGAARLQPGRDGMSSPENGHGSSSQSEQLPFFKDYYSNDNIYPGDRVSVLWAYHPRQGDEFEMEHGDMLKVIGIWDDGWATGIQVPERANEYVRRPQRDSGVSNGSRSENDGDDRPASPIPDGQVKAFPLVCVCLPQHWRKTIEGSESASPPAEIAMP